MSRHVRRPRRQAFAVIFALFLIALVGAALLALTSLMATDARRSTRGATDAQLRQLLHAGAVAAVQQVRAAGEFPQAAFDVALPRELADAPAALRVSRGDSGSPADEIHIVIDARLDDLKARQQLVLAREGDAWGVRSITR